MNTGLTLRTAADRDGIAAVRVGATLLYDSDPESEERETHIKARALLETLREVEEDRVAAERAITGPTEAEIAASGSADYPEGTGRRRTPARAAPLRVPAGGPPGLVRAHPGGLLPSARRRRDHAAVRLRPAVAARRDRPGPGRAVAGAGTACRLRLRRAAVGARPQAAAGFRRLPRPAGDGRARRRRTVAAARAAARQAGPDPGPRRLRERPVRRACPREFTAARYHSLYAKEADVKGGFTVTAATPDGAVMAIEDDDGGPLGGPVPPGVDPDRGRPLRPPDHRQRPGPRPRPVGGPRLTALPDDAA